MKRLSIKGQILLLALGLVTVALGFFILLANYHIKEELNKEVEWKALHYTVFLADNLSESVSKVDTQSVVRTIDGAIAASEVSAVCVCQKNDERIYFKSSEKELDTVDIDCPEYDTTIITDLPNQKIVSKAIFFKDKVVGDIWVAISKEKMKERMASSLYYMLGMAVAVLAVIILVTFFMSSKIVRPIKIFELAANRIQHGETGLAINLDSLPKDFRTLGTVFNSMCSALAAAFAELKTTRENLEEQVKERTSELEEELFERQKAEFALRESQQKLALHIQQTPLGVIQWNLDFEVVEWNLAAEKIFGYSAKEAIGKHAVNLIIPPSDRESADNIWIGLLSQKGGVRSTSKNITKSGEIVLCDWYNTPLVDKSGLTIGAASLVMDITEKQKSEQELKEQAAFAYNNPSPVLRASLEGYINNFNPGAERLFGNSLNKAAVWRILPNLTEDRLKGISRGRIFQFEQPIGSQHFLFNVKHDEETPYYFIYGTNITESKLAEEHQQRLQEELERAQRMESLGILAGGVAHDLNNMLGPLVGYPELIMMKLPEDSPIRKQVQRIARSAKEAADVIQDLLTLARRGRYEMVPTSLHDVIESYIDSPSFQKLSESRPEIIFKYVPDNRQFFINGSTPHLSKVVMNLIVNAYDAMPDSGQLTVSLKMEYLEKLRSGYDKSEPGDYAILSVKDSGTGIDPDDLDKIFEPYYSKKKMGTSGSGLGLSVVYGIVKDHGGYYDIFSTKGEGTEFVLYFPVIKEAIKTPETKKICVGGKETILVVDDVPEQRAIAKDILSSLGYQVNLVENGRAAIEYLRSNSVDLVLLDMIMEKDFDGLNTYEEIVKIHPGQKAIIVSGYSATERVDRMQSLGAGQYVRKPFTFDTLAKAVREELDKPAAEKSPVA